MKVQQDGKMLIKSLQRTAFSHRWLKALSCARPEEGTKMKTELTGRERFDNCVHKGYRRCLHHNNPIMEKAIIEDVPQSSISITLRSPSPEDIEEVAKLCEGCKRFRLIRKIV